MPSDERVRLHHREESTPVDQPRQRDECNPSCIVGTAGLHLPLHIQCQLFSQEQILGCEVRMRSYRRRDQPQEVTGDGKDGSKRGAGTGLGHGRRIVRDAVVKAATVSQVPGRSNRSDRGATR